MEIKQTLSDSRFALKMVNIHKSFNGGQVVANDGIDLFVEKNEVHAIVGENGAGKSTLMSILFGLYKPDAGEIYVNNKLVEFRSAKDAASHHIGMLHQHFSLVDNYSVLDNIILGNEIVKFGFINRKKSSKMIKEIMDKYNLHLDLTAKVGSLSVAQQQKVEILKVLYRNLDIIIFDEPTAVLSKNEIDSFLEMIKLFKSLGHTIVLITHKLHEVKEVADSVTVIRRGKLITRLKVADTTTNELAELMVGKKLVYAKNDSPSDTFTSEVVLDVKDLNLSKKNILSSYFFNYKKFFRELPNKIFHPKKNKKIKNNLQQNAVDKSVSFKQFFNQLIHPKKNKLKNVDQTSEKSKKLISFQVHAGEIFAIAGVSGNGQKEIVEALTGFRKVDAKIIKFLTTNVNKMSVGKRRKLGMSFVPEDRHRLGLTLDDTCSMNMVENVISNKPFSNFGFIRRFKIAMHTNDLIKQFSIHGTVWGTALARSLSGGNQQKIILARELYVDHKLLILVQPTRGLDIGAIEYVHQQIIEEKKRGKAILLISYELDEIFSLADTITVMNKKEFMGIYPRSQMTYEKIGKLMAGGQYE